MQKGKNNLRSQDLCFHRNEIMIYNKTTLLAAICIKYDFCTNDNKCKMEEHIFTTASQILYHILILLSESACFGCTDGHFKKWKKCIQMGTNMFEEIIYRVLETVIRGNKMPLLLLTNMFYGSTAVKKINNLCNSKTDDLPSNMTILTVIIP